MLMLTRSTLTNHGVRYPTMLHEKTVLLIGSFGLRVIYAT